MKVVGGERGNVMNVSRDKRYIIKKILYKLQRNGVTGRNERKKRENESERERERENERERRESKKKEREHLQLF